MSRPWILASVLAFAVTALSTTPAKAVKPQPPPPTITATLLSGAGGAPTIFAAATDGRILMARYNAWDYLEVQPYREVAQLPGKPVSIELVGTACCVMVWLENGDIYRSDVTSIPITFAFVENVFTSGGTGARLPAFPDLAPLEDAPASNVENAIGRTVPNPSKGVATLEYATKTAGTVRVRIFDASGRLVRTLQADHGTPGKHAATWDGSNDRAERTGSGVYYYRVMFPDGTETTKSLVRLR